MRSRTISATFCFKDSRRGGEGRGAADDDDDEAAP
eukprot:CAMPEP_0204068768 /NCGR_PEP_ID=MMETSP0360-20130528/155855_1 /ASSEMBLY_ACC=CAM_ASM_000342 /TAXON_ID=268821 /ORGANISM="Scrippsiella Hangoei, Strain SHTV-5" /LENGTH=34 /DNA_ID= /DNA_START= /DNA_END= /DNA_ORIENTATION=